MYKLEQLVDTGEPEYEGEWNERVRDSGVADGMDWPDFHNWTYRFLWLREAMKWFLEHLPTEQPKPEKTHARPTDPARP
jgi:hypothetical protein